MFDFYEDYKKLPERRKRWFRDALIDRLGYYIVIIVLLLLMSIEIK